mmetsp:Transcript_5601/g.8600  ORF Transcript_5601/g.8600 Transcript_5601/m.8600 type:complete len:564 (-) Transcript_5601:434-2125(-)
MKSDCEQNGKEVQSTESSDTPKDKKSEEESNTRTSPLSSTEHRMMAVVPARVQRVQRVQHVPVARGSGHCEHPHDSPGTFPTAVSTAVAANPGSETSSSDHVVSHIRTNSGPRSEVVVESVPSTQNSSVGNITLPHRTSQSEASPFRESSSEMTVALVTLPSAPVIGTSVHVPSESSNFSEQSAGEFPGPESPLTQSRMQNTTVVNLPPSTSMHSVAPAAKASSSKFSIVVLPASKKESKSPSEHRPRKRKLQTKPGQTSGRWTHEEHQAFLEGLKIFGREWKKVAERIPTRTSAQIRSHAQKYFSKLAREETMALDHESQPQSAYNSIAPEIPQPLPPSTQQRVEQILNDPSSAQREVEDTLRALRERYRQLQIRLEQRQRARQGRAGGPGSVVEADEDSAQHQHHRRNRQDMERRKAVSAVEDASSTTTNGSYQHQQQVDDDMSSVSSHLSASLASLSRAQDFRDEELLAVHVLGEAMPRSASSHDLVNTENNGIRPEESKVDETNRPASQEVAAPASVAAADAAASGNKTPSPVDPKKRKMSDGGDNDSTHDSNDEGMVM